MDQNKLNREMKEAGRDRYWRNINKAKGRGAESRTPYGQRMIENLLGDFIQNISVWVEARKDRKAGREHSLLKIIDNMDHGLLALFTARVAVDGAGNNRKLTDTYNSIGSLVEDEARFQYLKKQAPYLWIKLKKQLDRSNAYYHKRAIVLLAMNRNKDKLPFEKWDNPTKIRLGATLLDIFLKSTDVLDVYTKRTTRRKTINYLMITPDAHEWIAKFHEFLEFSTPVWLPTVEVPETWVTPYLGGYDAEVLRHCTLVKARNKNFIDTHIAEAEMPDVYEAVNTLQRTAWRVNQRVLEVADRCVDLGCGRGKLPCAVDPEDITKPLDIDTNEESRKKYRIEKSLQIQSNIKISSKRLRVMRTLGIAKRFQDEESIYFPFQLDFRGRAYCMSSYLSPQADDFSKSLLYFAEAKELKTQEAADWLAIHGANLFGYDKVSLTARAEWVKQHEKLIFEVGTDAESSTWWEEADKPWQFLAFCIEWTRFKQHGFGFLTHLPVQVDGTNNGLQLLSLLVRDLDGAVSTNCANNKLPVDAYQIVADKVLDILREDALAGNGIAKYWLEFGVDRKATKRPVMILPYGGTFLGSFKYVEEWYVEKLEDRKETITDFKLYNDRLTYIAKAIWNGVNLSVGRAKEVMSWMAACSRILSKYNRPFHWTTPVGLPVLQEYKDLDAYRIKTSLGDKIKLINLVRETTTISKHKQANGISPNFIHSLDAAILHKSIVLCNMMGLKSYNMIHDSFGVHATDVDSLNAAIRVAITQLFRNNLLEKFRAEMQEQVPEEELPPVPLYGSFDLREVLESEYMFS